MATTTITAAPAAVKAAAAAAAAATGLDTAPSSTAAAAGGRIFAAGKGDMLLLEPGHCPALAEWHLHKRIVAQTFKTERERSRSGVVYSRQRFLFKVRRKFGAYVENVALTCFLISTLSGAAYFIEVTEDRSTPDRIMVLLTLLLSAVSFRFVVRSYLPSISYMTLLDHYVRASLVFIVAACIEVSAVGLASTNGTFAAAGADPQYVDDACWLALLVGWTAFNAYCLLRVLRHWAAHDENKVFTDRFYAMADREAAAAALLQAAPAVLELNHDSEAGGEDGGGSGDVGEGEGAGEGEGEGEAGGGGSGGGGDHSEDGVGEAHGLLKRAARASSASVAPAPPASAAAAARLLLASETARGRANAELGRRFGWRFLGMPNGDDDGEGESEGGGASDRGGGGAPGLSQRALVRVRSMGQ